MHFKKTNIALLFLGVCIILVTPSVSFAYDTSAWQKFLDVYLKDGLVNYSTVRNNPAFLRDSISQLENTKKEEYDQWSKDEKKAFWINAYNVEAIKLVLDHYPLKKSLGLQALRYPTNSIQQIPDVWNQEVLTILGNKVSLNYIENEILRKEFQDPRIHFAIVCASLGCPVLREEPYVSDQLDARLNDQVGKFILNPKKVRYDSHINTLYVSPIFKWFRDDFEKVGGIIAFVRKYMPSNVKLSDDAKIQWLDYDWSLNEQKFK